VCSSDLLAQLLLLAALRGELGERQRHRGEQPDDRHRDQQLDEGKACAFFHCCFCGCGPAAGGTGGKDPGTPPVGPGWEGTVEGTGPLGDGVGPGVAGGGADSTGEPGRASEAPPTSASVPELNSSSRMPGRSTLRITRGVMSSTT